MARATYAPSKTKNTVEPKNLRMRIEVINHLPTKPIVAPIIEAETIEEFTRKVKATGGKVILPKFKKGAKS